ncbi:MAG: cobalt-precorrin-5B (C(1))-methyltransferase CbiD [Desulfuromonadaceae bacterium]|nr:cobalt-precorrin-5B (C(1))-methyltransferase CbiD [Desulfuromonadaceae bacterium]MDD5106352.1 cobalt-precorrin-5B (C(1))-methyltransferase CbiD [Desulfuromonadaceae bacterium]
MPRSTPPKRLRTGFTTGACAAAAAKGAALMLVRQEYVGEVTIDLPAGFSVPFVLHGQSFSTESATCFVVKDAGDDPDVTNGTEVHATISTTPPVLLLNEMEGAVVIEGGVGIGKVTKPGLAVHPGEWAINPVPRRMIKDAVRPVFSSLISHPSAIHVVISIPDGEERAKKTLNSRLGIIGGLSILGTTGIVRPVSAKAWTDTIDAALDVARACGCTTVVLSTGRSSEIAAQSFWEGKGCGQMVLNTDLSLPEEAYIMMGDHVGYALQACQKRGFNQPVIACQFAKMLKIACGHHNTHAADSQLDLVVLKKWAESAQISPELLEIISRANTAREIAVATAFDKTVVGLVANRVRLAAAGHAPGIKAEPLLCGYDGTVIT